MRHKILRAVLRFFAVVAASFLLLAVLVWIPLKTHRPSGSEPDMTSSSVLEEDGLKRRPSAVGTDIGRIEPTPAAAAQADAERPPLSSAAPDDAEQEQLPFEFPDPEQTEESPELQALLDEFVKQNPGCWDICVCDLSGGSCASVKTQEEPMVSASLIKLFIMGSFYQAMQDGTLESWQYWETFPSVRSMIIYSDNYCANWLITSPLGKGSDSVGFEYVTAFAESIGCEDTRLERLMLDNNSEHENYTSAEDCARLLKLIYRCELITPEYSNEMLELLKGQTINDRIPAGLPDDVVCAHKTGNLEHLSCGDVGLVFSPGADYILCVISNHAEDDAAATEQIAALSAEVYAFFNPETPDVAAEAQETEP